MRSARFGGVSPERAEEHTPSNHVPPRTAAERSFCYSVGGIASDAARVSGRFVQSCVDQGTQTCPERKAYVAILEVPRGRAKTQDRVGTRSQWVARRSSTEAYEVKGTDLKQDSEVRCCLQSSTRSFRELSS